MNPAPGKSCGVNFKAQTAQAHTHPVQTQRACDIDGASLYQTPALFHGPELHAIRRFSGLGDRSATAELFSSRDLGWERGNELLDLAAWDGGLQVALGWLFRESGASMLPTYLGEVSWVQAPSATGAITCTLSVQSLNALQAHCDIIISGNGWSARMSGVQLNARVTVPAESVHA